MEDQFPGKSCVEALIRGYHKVEEGEYAPPLNGTLRVESAELQALIPLNLVANIERVGDSKDAPAVKITLLVKSEVPWKVRFGKDAKGKHIFTDPSLDE